MPDLLPSPTNPGASRISSYGLRKTCGSDRICADENAVEILAFAVWIVYQAVRGVSTKRRAALWFAILFAAVFVFGIAVEWRVWLVFVPYVILTLAVSNNPPLVNSDYDSN